MKTKRVVELKKREDGWISSQGLRLVPNSRFPQIPQESKRYLKMSEDIRNFSGRLSSLSYAGSSNLSDLDPFSSVIMNTKPDAPKSPFELISSAFGFSHHSGTDRASELVVLKQIVKRENLLTSLHSNVEKLIEAHNFKGLRVIRAPSRSEILGLLTNIRDITVNLIESICIWRLSSGIVGILPKPFLWDGENYLIKVQSDLDFLCDTLPLIELLGIPREKLLANPLMLPNSVFEAGQWSSPEERTKLGKS